MNKKNIATAAVSLALVGVMAIGGTLAYLTDDSDTMTNTFVMDGLTITLKEDATIPKGEVYLQKETDETEYSTDEIQGAVKGVDYDKLLPGATVDKNPYLEIGASNAHAYVYAYVTGINTTAPEEDATAPVVWVDQWNTGWEVVANTGLKGTLLRQEVACDASTTEELLRLDIFETVHVNPEITTTTSIDNVTIQAFAHQADNVTDGVADQAAIAYFAKSAL